MERLKNIALVLFLALFVASLCINVHFCTTKQDGVYRDTVRTTFVDTIPFYKPVPKEVKLLGSITAKFHVSVPKFPENIQMLPVSVPNSQDSVSIFGNYVPDDSITVEIPITQKVYEDSTYKAYISGYNPQLDSLIFRMPREVIAVKEYRKPKRWGIGIQVGYGVTVKKMPQFTPYVGIGISYNLFSF